MLNIKFIISVISLLLVQIIQHHPHYPLVVERVVYRGVLPQRLSENAIPGPHGCGMATIIDSFTQIYYLLILILAWKVISGDPRLTDRHTMLAIAMP